MRCPAATRSTDTRHLGPRVHARGGGPARNGWRLLCCNNNTTRSPRRSTDGCGFSAVSRAACCGSWETTRRRSGLRRRRGNAASPERLSSRIACRSPNTSHVIACRSLPRHASVQRPSTRAMPSGRAFRSAPASAIRSPGRVGASLLRDRPSRIHRANIGCSMKTSSPCDAAGLRDVRRRLDENRLSTPLFDAPAFTRNLEAAYRQMLDQCERR